MVEILNYSNLDMEEQKVIMETREAINELYNNIIGNPENLKYHNMKFSDNTDDINTQIVQLLFDDIVIGNYAFDKLGKNKKLEIEKYITQYIKDSTNKGHVLNQYINNLPTFPQWIEKIISDTYSHEEIGAYELQNFFSKNGDIISIGKGIIGQDWDGSNINNPKNIFNTYHGIFFTKEQFITEFNKRNTKRIDTNMAIIKNIDLYSFIKENTNIKKKKGNLYINNTIITKNSIFKNNYLINAISQSISVHIANLGELQKMLQNIYSDENQHILYEKIYNTTEESNENYIFHDTGLDFFTEDTLEDQDTILNNFKRSIGSTDDLNTLKEKNDDLQKIIGILPINNNDTPDTKNEKKRLIYLLNHGLFRGFQLAINSLNKSGINCCNSSPYLSQNNKTYSKLSDHLNRYQSEKKEYFYQLIDDIRNLDINFSSNLFDGTSTKAHLKNPQKRQNIINVVNLAKSYFIQKIKDDQTENVNIETYKNQLAYLLSTMERESGYQYSAHTKTYGGYGQIKFAYTDLWTLFSQGSGLDFGIKDNDGNEVKGQDIKFTKSSFTEEKFSTFAFVYGMIYGHLSNRGSLDTYINDGNVDNPDFWNARNIEAGANNQHYTNTAKLWKKVIDESSNIS